MKKGLGNSTVRLIQKYKHSATLRASTSLMFQDRKRRLGFDVSKAFDEEGKLVLTGGLSFDYDGKGQLALMPPSLSLQSQQLAPISFVASGALGQGLSLGTNKDPGAGNIPFGYNVNAQISSEEIAISPTLMYDFENYGMIGHGGFSLSTSGNHSQ